MYSQINERTGLVEQLVDARNVHVLEEIKAKINQMGQPVGFDIETHDADRHEGLNQFMKLNKDDEDYRNPKKLVFDINRTTVTGFSLYIRGDTTVYYANAAHADADNRIPPDIIRSFIQYMADHPLKIIHNYPFERTMCFKSLGIDLGWNYVDTLQMAVSAYNSDQYDIEVFRQSDLLGIKKLIPQIRRTFAGVQDFRKLDTAQQELMQKVLAKESKADHSYNGYVKSINYGYNLKQITERIFGYKQTSFKDALQGKAHMGLLTGEEVLHYGADDAYWCVRIYDWLCQFMQNTNPAVLRTFFEQENPMCYVYSDCWVKGWRVNKDAVLSRRETERANYIEVIKELGELLQTLEFPEAPAPRLYQKQPKWYVGKEGISYQRYRDKILFLKDGYADFMLAQEVHDAPVEDFDFATLTSGPVSIPWMEEEKFKLKKKELDLRGNFSHYMVQRTLFHDLLYLPFVYIKGDIKTDAEARGKLIEFAERLGSDPALWVKEWKRYGQLTELPEETLQTLAEQCCEQYPTETAKAVIKAINKLSQIEQRMKLYITNYLLLTDPDTDRMYPIISSRLNTRRMAAENPNPMQLSKRGDSTYIRGFFLPHRDDHLLVAVDWSQVELVLIGELSKDPNFQKAYGQIPYEDLHLGAATSAIKVFYPDFTSGMLASVKNLEGEELEAFKLQYHRVLIDPVKNAKLEPYEVAKWWRGSAGKPSNFGYWYSGSLMTVQDKLGWTSDEMWAGTDNYRDTFPVAEQWRVNTQREIEVQGYVDIFDGHRRYKYEGTNDWFYHFTAKWDAYNDPVLSQFGAFIAKKIQRRAGNQAVNAKIQGGCATLAKRAMLKLWHEINAPDTKWDADIVMPIHDELVFSVRWDQAVDFGQRILEVMCNHPDLVSWLKLDGTVSVGRTLEPYHPTKAPFGQVELDEAPELEGYIPKELKDTKLSIEYRHNVVSYLMGHEPVVPVEGAA